MLKGVFSDVCGLHRPNLITSGLSQPDSHIDSHDLHVGEKTPSLEFLIRHLPFAVCFQKKEKRSPEEELGNSGKMAKHCTGCGWPRAGLHLYGDADTWGSRRHPQGELPAHSPTQPLAEEGGYERSFNHSVLAVKCQCWKLSSIELARNTPRPPGRHRPFLNAHSYSQHTYTGTVFTAVQPPHSVTRKC